MKFRDRFEHTLNQLKDITRNKLILERRGITWYIYISLNLNFRKAADHEKRRDPYVTFNSDMFTSMNMDNINHMFRTVPNKIFQQIENYESNGSGWVVDHFLDVDLGIVNYNPLQASLYKPTLKSLKFKKTIVNIDNNNQKCFTWSVLEKLYPQPNSPHRVSPYKRLEHNLHMTVIDYLVKTSDIKKFEQLNSNIAVNVYEYEDEVISPSEYQVFMRDNTVSFTVAIKQ